MWEAIQSGSYRSSQNLIQQGADVNWQNPDWVRAPTPTMPPPSPIAADRRRKLPRAQQALAQGVTVLAPEHSISTSLFPHERWGGGGAAGRGGG